MGTTLTGWKEDDLMYLFWL